MYRHGRKAKFETLVDEGAIPGIFLGFEDGHIIRILNDKGCIVRATAAHFQEQRTVTAYRISWGAKWQCLKRLDHNDEFELPIRPAWFTDPDDV